MFLKPILLGAAFACALPVAAQEPAFRDYDAWMESAGAQMEAFVRQHPNCKEINGVRQTLLEDLRPDNRVTVEGKLPARRKKVLTAEQISTLCRKSALMCFGMERGPKATRTYPIASATVLTEDGLCATNYHVLSNVILSGAMLYAWPDDYQRFLMDEDGKVYPIEKIVAADPVNDFALFKVNTAAGKLTPLPLGDTAPQGAEVYCLSHTRDLPFYLTQGIVARNVSSFNRRNGHSRQEMQITADYGVGASGGPIIDRYGNLAGIVGSTFSMYANQQAAANFQMSVKKAVPVKLIRDCFAARPQAETDVVTPAAALNPSATATDTPPTVPAGYGVRYRWSYLYNKEKQLTYQEERVVWVSSAVTLDAGYRHRPDSSAAPKELRFTPSSYFFEPGKNRLRQTYRIGLDDFLLADTLCANRWTVEEDMRVIGEYLCKKAVCSYGGRTWTAWFTTDLPHQAAPWRLAGLSGVVLEVADATGEVKWEFCGLADAGTGKQQARIEYPRQFAPIPGDKFPLIRKLFALSPVSYVGEAINLSPQMRQMAGFPSLGIDACLVTNPLVLTE